MQRESERDERAEHERRCDLAVYFDPSTFSERSGDAGSPIVDRGRGPCAPRPRIRVLLAILSALLQCH